MGEVVRLNVRRRNKHKIYNYHTKKLMRVIRVLKVVPNEYQEYAIQHLIKLEALSPNVDKEGLLEIVRNREELEK